MTSTMNEQNLLTRIDELECKLAFQDQLIDDLNQAITAQQAQLEKMRVQMQFMVGKVKAMSPSQIASERDETPPPHY
ncbi:Protein SlyX [Vibrio stylophorae]|uniref:Protein SlyX homolog n=1 Tax=Vibrio stylophorae TaxID=659351 RepID=A0ABN8DUR9_9VIBR|nr:Protein SlyX [Vibrio stylophorae]